MNKKGTGNRATPDSIRAFLLGVTRLNPSLSPRTTATTVIMKVDHATNALLMPLWPQGNVRALDHGTDSYHETSTRELPRQSVRASEDSLATTVNESDSLTIHSHDWCDRRPCPYPLLARVGGASRRSIKRISSPMNLLISPRTAGIASL